MRRKPCGPELFAVRPDLPLAMESELWDLGFRRLAGVDEAGRGPLAGPVVAAAVVIGPEFDATGIDDSKKLTHIQRLKLFGRIVKQAQDCAVGYADPREIEELNILECAKLAMCRALEKLSDAADYVLVDGNSKLPISLQQRTIIGGDAKVVSIAAASILAKVTRDFIMAAYHEGWPQYKFISNKGYPTRAHKIAVAQNGPCRIHRRTFSGVKEFVK